MDSAIKSRDVGDKMFKFRTPFWVVTTKVTNMDAIETIQTKTKKVSCEGNNTNKSLGKSLGHPRVFLNMGEKDHIDCPYCGRRYQYCENHKECK